MRLFGTNENGEFRYSWEEQLSDEIREMTVEQLSEIGWFVVEDAPKPLDTQTETYDMGIEVADGIHRIAWITRLKTIEELTREGIKLQIEALNSLLGEAGVVSMSTLRGIKASTNADINASPAKYIKALTDIMIELVQSERRNSRMAIKQFDSLT